MDDPHLKTTSKNMKSGISQQPLIKSFSIFKPELRGQNQNGKVQERKTTFNGGRYQIIKSGISQQLPIRSYSNYKLELRGPNQNGKVQKSKTTNIKSGIYQQPLIRLSSNIKHNLKGQFA